MAADIEALWKEAIAHHSAGRPAAAIANYLQIIGRDANHHVVMNHLGAALAETGNHAEALHWLAKSVELSPARARYWFNYGRAYQMTGKLDEAAGCFAESHRLDPANKPNIVQLARVQTQRKDHAHAIELLRPLLSANPNEIEIIDLLVIAYYESGHVDYATQLSRHSLTVKDFDAQTHHFETGNRQPRPAQVSLRSRLPPPPPTPETRHRNIIALSLWSDAPRMVGAARGNIRRAKVHLPHWQVRVYCAAALEDEAIKVLKEEGAEVIPHGSPPAPGAGAFRNLESLGDDLCHRVLLRDAERGIGAKEAAAVAAWVESGLPFHIMRDHVCTLEILPAGFWGAISGRLGGVTDASRRYAAGPARQACQLFLRNEIWPVIKSQCLIHDGVHDLFEARPFPDFTPGENEPPFVGAMRR